MTCSHGRRAWLAGALLAVCTAASAQAPAPVKLLQNVRIFDGKGSRLSAPSQVLVRGDLIERVSTVPIASPPGANVIDGQGRTLMPGLIDKHWHTMFAAASMAELLHGDLGYLTLLAAAEARATLLRGFTTVRDLGGPSFAPKRAIDEGRIPGPRIYPSGAMITITGGHGDFRMPYELPRQIGALPPIAGALNASGLADSPDQVRLRTREQPLPGAS
jgi:imidazolonepropionase-like amidohydrolase